MYTYSSRHEATTIFADDGLMNSLKRIALKEKMSLSATIRRALDEYVARRRDVAERAEELL